MTLCLATIQKWCVPAVLVARPSGYLAPHNQPHNKLGFLDFLSMLSILIKVEPSKVVENICIL